MNARRITFGMHPTPGQTRKYGNKKTEVDGITFDSKKEAKRYQALKLLERSGHVRNLRWGVKYDLTVNDVKIATYKADFVYDEKSIVGKEWTEIVEDVKGYANDRWPMKKKLFKAIYGKTIRET